MDTLELINLAHTGDKDARDRLVTENVGLIWSIVRRFMNRGHDSEDLFQIGCIGLIKAIDKFDTSFGVQFSTYAVPMITGEIKRFLRDDGMIKVSRNLKENALKIKNAREGLQGKLGREPTIEEISEVTKLDKEDIVMALDAGMEVESIYKSVYKNDGSEIYLLDQIVSGGGEEEKILDNMLLCELIDNLDKQDRNLMKMRYFQNKTQSEVAKALGMSQVQVSRKEKKILMSMRQKVTE